MRTRHRSPSLLILVALLAVALTLLLSGTSAARPAPQESPLDPSPTPTLTATITRQPGFQVSPLVTVPPLAAPTSIPLPPPAQPSPTASGFLPAPTITNPDDIDSLPLARPAVSGGGIDEPFPSPTPRQPANRALAASVAILNVLWLICGGILVISGVVVMILLARRSSDA